MLNSYLHEIQACYAVIGSQKRRDLRCERAVLAATTTHRRTTDQATADRGTDEITSPLIDIQRATVLSQTSAKLSSGHHAVAQSTSS